MIRHEGDWFEEYSEQARKTLRYFFALEKIKDRLAGPADDQLHDIRQIVDAVLSSPLPPQERS